MWEKESHQGDCTVFVWPMVKTFMEMMTGSGQGAEWGKSIFFWTLNLECLLHNHEFLNARLVMKCAIALSIECMGTVDPPDVKVGTICVLRWHLKLWNGWRHPGRHVDIRAKCQEKREGKWFPDGASRREVLGWKNRKVVVDSMNHWRQDRPVWVKYRRKREGLWYEKKGKQMLSWWGWASHVKGAGDWRNFNGAITNIFNCLLEAICLLYRD